MNTSRLAHISQRPRPPQPVGIPAMAQSLAKEIAWFEQVLDLRFKLYFMNETPFTCISQLPAPALNDDPSEYAQCVRQYGLSDHDRLIVILSLLPSIKPQTLDSFFIQNKSLDRVYTEFGGLKGNQHSGFLPTLETALFLLAGDDIEQRFNVLQCVSPNGVLISQGLIRLGQYDKNEPRSCAPLMPGNGLLNLAEPHSDPSQAPDFPAQLISSPLDWSELIIGHDTQQQLNKLLLWGQHQRVLLQDWGLAKSFKAGYRALFYGPPGTGKTLTATLLGQQLNMPVYRVDLSAIVSKYIGETEKNLENLFVQAENRQWVLFFDEADALFGARTGGNSANERHANQEIAYLLQRIEDFPGIVILATNLRGNIDEAFARRFQSLIYFPLPDARQRLTLWQTSLNGRLNEQQLPALQQLAQRYDVAGGSIANVVRFGALAALERGDNYIDCTDLEAGIIQELRKEGRRV